MGEDVSDDEIPGEMDPEFQKFLISQLPEEVRSKFEDPNEHEAFMRRVDAAIRKVGLRFLDGKLAVNPMDNKAYLQLTCEIDPAEDKYQQEKELRAMMYDTQQDEIERRLKELREQYAPKSEE